MKTQLAYCASFVSSRAIVVAALIGSAVALSGCERYSVDPEVASVGSNALAGLAPEDLDQFAIQGDLERVANCRGHIATNAQTKYGDSMGVSGGDVQGFGSRDKPLRFMAVREKGVWVIVSSDFGPRDATPLELKEQVGECVSVLGAKMHRAENRKATQENNQASWSPRASVAQVKPSGA